MGHPGRAQVTQATGGQEGLMHLKSQNVGTETMAPGAGAEIATVARWRGYRRRRSSQLGPPGRPSVIIAGQAREVLVDLGFVVGLRQHPVRGGVRRGVREVSVGLSNWCPGGCRRTVPGHLDGHLGSIRRTPRTPDQQADRHLPAPPPATMVETTVKAFPCLRIAGRDRDRTRGCSSRSPRPGCSTSPAGTFVRCGPIADAGDWPRDPLPPNQRSLGVNQIYCRLEIGKCPT